jgi:DNA-binding protein H-NS
LEKYPNLSIKELREKVEKIKKIKKILNIILKEKIEIILSERCCTFFEIVWNNDMPYIKIYAEKSFETIEEAIEFIEKEEEENKKTLEEYEKNVKKIELFLENFITDNIDEEDDDY